MYTSMYTYCMYCVPIFFMRDMDLSSCRVSRLHPTMHIEPKLKIWALFLQYFLVAEVREKSNQFVWVELHENIWLESKEADKQKSRNQ